jgi:hypothetical protein
MAARPPKEVIQVKSSVQKTAQTILLTVLAILLIAILAACSSATTDIGGSNGKVVTISKENVPLSGPQASEQARATFENGTAVNTSPIENGTVTLNCNLVDKGIIGIRADIATSQRLKLKASKDGIDIYYDISPNAMIKIPMQLGNGKYNIELFENIQGANYKQLYHKEMDILLSDPNSVFLYSNQVVDFENKTKADELALALTKDAKTDADKIKAVYDYVTSHISYDYNKISTVDTSYIPDVDAILTSNTGICYDYAAVTAAMLREAGVPAKLVKGYRSDNANYHAWNEVLIGGQWMTLDATFDATARQNGQAYEMKKDAGMYKADKVF